MYTEQEFTALIGEVQKEFATYLAKAESDETTPLAKAEDEKPEAKKEDKKPEAKDEKKDDKPEAKADVPAEKQDAPPAAPTDEAAAAPAEDAPPAAPGEEAAPAAPPVADEGHGYDPEDLQHMQAMYASMSRPELIAHHDAIKAVLDGMGMEKCGDMSAAPAPMVKSEETTAVEVKPEVVVETSKESELLKSELASKDTKIQELQKTLDAVTAFVTKLVEKKAAPAGKAITQLDTIAKSEEVKEEKELSKQEVTAILTKKASDPKLEKSDREAINTYYATGQINLTGISHLLK